MASSISNIIGLIPAPATLRVRAVFDNKDRMLSAGLFVRIRLRSAGRIGHCLFPNMRSETDQGKKFQVCHYADDEVTYRPVQVGKVHDRQRVINSGLSSDEGAWS